MALSVESRFGNTSAAAAPLPITTHTMDTLHTTPTDFCTRRTDRADVVEARYREMTSGSRRLSEEARSVMPGGSTRTR